MLRLMHFTPTDRRYWCWRFFRPVLTLLPGPQTVLTGETINHPGSTLWEGVPGMPSFPELADALRWCEGTGTVPDLIDLPGQTPAHT